MSNLLYLFSCLLLTYSAFGESVTFIKKCKSGDSKCGKEAAQAAIPVYTVGVPELGIEALDPMYISKLDASTAGLKLTILDAVVTGLKTCKAKKMQRDNQKLKLIVKLECDVRLEGKYEMNGQLLILPMEGKGPVHAKLTRMVITADCDLDLKTDKDGKEHWSIKQWKHGYELRDKADVVFENLFSGNEVLGRAARELIANNGNEIVNEVGPPIIRTVISNIVKNINQFFRKYPIEDFAYLD